MFQSLIQDLKHNYRHGNMVTRLIIINVSVFVVTALIKAFAPSFYSAYILDFFAISAEPLKLITRPWTIITHMFIHSGGWHLFWNMILLYWFGRIVGDLLNDRRIWPLYFLGALVGAVFYFLSYHLFSNVVGMYAVGASAGIMAIIAAAGAIAPDYSMRLILLGDVKLKYVVAALIFMDILASQGYSNAGGAFAHLGGAAFGFYFISLLRNGKDLSENVNNGMDKINQWFRSDSPPKKKRSRGNLKVKHRSGTSPTSKNQLQRSANLQEEVDRILEKIKQSGYDSLTDTEKEILFQASKNS